VSLLGRLTLIRGQGGDWEVSFPERGLLARGGDLLGGKNRVRKSTLEGESGSVEILKLKGDKGERGVAWGEKTCQRGGRVDRASKGLH